MSRIVRELRDAAPYSPDGSSVSYPAIRYARGGEVRFYTTFNEAGNQDPAMLPTYTRFLVAPGPSASDGLCLYLEKDASSGGSTGGFTADESRILVRNLTNVTGVSDVFAYTSVNPDATRVTTSTPVTTDSITAVNVTLLVDLNPGHSPQAYRLHATVQPRNLRHN
jgi:hypothetical protein